MNEDDNGKFRPERVNKPAVLLLFNINPIEPLYFKYGYHSQNICLDLTVNAVFFRKLLDEQKNEDGVQDQQLVTVHVSSSFFIYFVA